MGKTKSNLFSSEQNRLAEMAKALAHPARIAILEHLMEHGTCVCGDIVDKLPLSQATISQHLKAMKESGIIRGSVDGTYRCYCIDARCCSSIRDQFFGLFNRLLKCC